MVKTAAKLSQVKIYHIKTSCTHWSNVVCATSTKLPSQVKLEIAEISNHVSNI